MDIQGIWYDNDGTETLGVVTTSAWGDNATAVMLGVRAVTTIGGADIGWVSQTAALISDADEKPGTAWRYSTGETHSDFYPSMGEAVDALVTRQIEVGFLPTGDIQAAPSQVVPYSLRVGDPVLLPSGSMHLAGGRGGEEITLERPTPVILAQAYPLHGGDAYRLVWENDATRYTGDYRTGSLGLLAP